MGEHHIGVDIGSFAVRAAEVSVEGGVAVLHRFAQVTLPPRAVVEGEIVDAGAVAGGIRELWARGGFKRKKAVVGLSTRDVKVRQVDVPSMSPDDVRATLRYDAQDLLPVADADAVVDFLVQDHLTRDGSEMLRVLVVAAPRAHLDATVAAVSAAGIEVEGVDLVPFALVRCLAGRGEPGSGEVIVSVGAGLTSVVVEVDGVPQMVRTTAGGGATITDALAGQLSLDYEEAEAVKRTASPHTPEGLVATSLIDEQLGLLVHEIVGSVEYFVAQTRGEVRQLTLTGAGSLVPGLRERIRAESHLDVVAGDALRYVMLGKTELSPEQLIAASTTLAGPIGLALAPSADPDSRLTGLLPGAYVRRVAARREAKLAACAVGALGLGLLGMWGQRTFSVRAARDRVTHVARREQLLAGRDAQFVQYSAQETELLGRTAAVRAALGTDTDGATMLDQVSAALPPDVWLRSAAVTMPSVKSAGSMTFTLGGVDSSAPAHWLEQMRALNGVFSQVWVSGITASSSSGGHTPVQFASQATFARSVVSHRADAFGAPK